MKNVLTIATSDCSGGAGIQADLKTMGALGTYGMSVICSMTAQNTCGVISIHHSPIQFIEDQIDQIFTDIVPDSIKIGMVPTSEMHKLISTKLKEYNAANIVLDPVMVATSGATLMDSEGAKASVDHLFPIADIITPNMDEAGFITGIKVVDKESMLKAATSLQKLTPGYVLVKGGHLSDSADDLLYKNGEYTWIKGDKLSNPNIHGTGCTLSSAIASFLANGYNVENAVKKAKFYLTGAIKDSMDKGKCSGPLNHFYNYYPTCK